MCITVLHIENNSSDNECTIDVSQRKFYKISGSYIKLHHLAENYIKLHHFLNVKSLKNVNVVGKLQNSIGEQFIDSECTIGCVIMKLNSRNYIKTLC